MTTSSDPIRFEYEHHHLDAGTGVVTCSYVLGSRRFVEEVRLTPGPGLDTAAARAAARLVFLAAGISYYKTAAPPVIDFGATPTTPAERDWLRAFYLDGLGEFAYRNGIDLSGLTFEGPLAEPHAVEFEPAGGSPLVPFGGGIDSIVTTEEVRRHHPGTAVFVVSRRGDHFDAIERPLAVTGLPVVRAERALDPQVLDRGAGFLNGHVPVTGILSAIAVTAAVATGRDAVIMSNEWSASSPNLEVGGRAVNHQYSKSLDFEARFARVLEENLGGRFTYFSLLRSKSELWVAERFARLAEYHPVFRSCNRAFSIDPARRLDHWCGECDKCCFIDLVLAPFLEPAALRHIFDGNEPLENSSLEHRFATLLGISESDKPFECVGDVGECRAALTLTAERPDRAGEPVLSKLRAALARVVGDMGAPTSSYFEPLGTDRVPPGYRPDPT